MLSESLKTFHVYMSDGDMNAVSENTSTHHENTKPSHNCSMRKPFNISTLERHDSGSYSNEIVRQVLYIMTHFSLPGQGGIRGTVVALKIV